MLEWIPYNQFSEIKETGTNGLITVYSAIWNEGDSDEDVALKYLHKSQESIDYLINEHFKYCMEYLRIQLLEIIFWFKITL
ncbi:unnamed protein product [Rhizophagus irregularis]|nr:unnamed protein product [Rhizophagus irregularis]